MSRKQGIIVITPELLKAALRLPDDVTVEAVFQDPPSRVGLRINIVVSGDNLPVAELPEGAMVPMLTGQYDTQLGWKFWEAKMDRVFPERPHIQLRGVEVDG